MGVVKDLQATSEDSTGIIVDIHSGKHQANLPKDLLDRRQLIWHPQYGWTYDVWVNSAYDYALSGPHGRFAVPHLLRNLRVLATDLSSAVFRHE